MNTTLRAVVFGIAVAAATVTTLGTVTAAEATQVVRLETVHVVAHRGNFDADGNVVCVQLDPVVVVGHRNAVG